MNPDEEGWSIDIHCKYMDRDRMIQQFEEFVQQIKDGGYHRGGNGNSAASWYIKGPRPHPLTDTEIQKIRNLIR